jgi:hypothetical protein
MGGKGGGLDLQFRAQFEKLLREKIVIKALGNSGTDLSGRTSEARRHRQVGPTGDMTSYDALLIAELLSGLANDHLILAQSWTLNGDAVALSATVPGDNQSAIARVVGAPGEGVFSFATGNFESGSSFAAPQISAVISLLLEAQSQASTTDISALTKIVRNRKFMDADAAFRLL